jgi:hypothetical protein
VLFRSTYALKRKKRHFGNIKLNIRSINSVNGLSWPTTRYNYDYLRLAETVDSIFTRRMTDILDTVLALAVPASSRLREGWKQLMIPTEQGG